MYKLYLKGNYVFLEILATGQKLPGFSKEVKIIPNSKQRTVYTVLNIHGWSESTPINLSELQKENGDAYTSSEFETFYTESTGNFSSASGGSGAIYTEEERLAVATISGKLDKGAYTGGDAQTLNLAVQQAATDLLTKLPKGTYTGTAQDLKNDIINATTGVTGISVVPTDTPTGTGVASWIAVQNGTYTNFGGKVLPVNSVGVISRSATNDYTISYTALDMSLYLKTEDFSKIIKTDSLGNLNFIDENGNIGAILKGDGTFVINDLDLRNQTTAIPFNDINAAGFINGVKIESNDDYQIVSIDQNGNIGYAVDLEGNVIENKTTYERLYGLFAVYNHTVVYGQSNSVGAGSNGVTTTTTVPYIYTFEKGPIMISYDNDATKYNSLVLQKENSIETVSASFARAFKNQMINDGITINDTTHPYNIIISNAGEGGTSVEQLSKGTTNYQRFIDGVVNGKRLTNELGKSYNVPCVFWLQGESNYTTPASKYKVLLSQLQKDINNDVKEITGQLNDVVFINYQLASLTTHTILDVFTALMDICEESPYFFKGPALYPYSHADVHHLSKDGHMRVGALAGYIANQIIIKGIDWKGLSYKSHYINGKIAELLFDVPKPPLVLDTVWITNPGNYGFRLFNSQMVEKTITNVLLVRDNRVLIESSTIIEKGDILTYAVNGTGVGPVNGARGCLRDSQGDSIIHDPTGLNFKLHNWLPISKIIL